MYAALSLHGEPAAERAWSLLTSWQLGDGSWRPSRDVRVAHWDTALCVTMATMRGEFGEPFRKGVDWLVHSAGNESSLLNRTAARVGLFDPERDLSLEGWPWSPNSSSWLEPTVHTLVALKKASARLPNSGLRERIRLGEGHLMDVRCRDAGWNYGTSTVRRIELPSYPETTALALVGLQGHADLAHSLDLAVRMARETPSPMARAWLSVALHLNEAEVPVFPAAEPSSDILITAIEALGSAEGNHKVFRTGGAA